MSEKSGSGNSPEGQSSAPTEPSQPAAPAPAAPAPAAPPTYGQPPYPGQPPYYGQPAPPAPPARRRLPAWVTGGRTLIAAAALVLALLVGGAGFAIGRATANDHRGGPGLSDRGGWSERGPGSGQHGNGQFPQGPQGGQLPGQGTAWLPSAGSPESSTTRSREQVA